MSEKIKIGLAQLLVEGGEPERNLERAYLKIKEASYEGCDVCLLPETLDFGWTHPSALTGAQTIPGMYSDFFIKTAIEFKIDVCVGLTELFDGEIYNSAIYIDKRGKILSKYRKINITKAGAGFYQIGSSLNVFKTDYGLVGLNICSDNYMESTYIGKTLGKMGAQIILSPSSWTVDYNVSEDQDPYLEKWIKPYELIAKSMDLVMVGVTSVGYIVGGPYEGKKMVGCSLVVDKDGVLAKGEFNEFAGDLIIVETELSVK